MLSRLWILAVGIGIGFSAGILTAPRSGEETASLLLKMIKNAAARLHSANHTLEPLAEDLLR
ncbi:MAG: YtxH domain-containing protein [Chloroflexi bacterium]|nr:YtxH domain-containing protein [Chloroflexota bacterium]MCL5946760.1 YtxH domain-containing protein [Chloroflexota bacterium]